MEINCPQTSTHIHDTNVSLFLTAIADFKMSRLSLQQRIFVIEFWIKHDKIKDCKIPFHEAFNIIYFIELKDTVRQVVSIFLCGNAAVLG